MTFHFQPIFEKGNDTTEYRLLTSDGLGLEKLGGRQILTVTPEALTKLADEAFDDVSHLLRTSHLEKLASILKDPEASEHN